MANVLFVKANSLPADQAISVQLYDAIIIFYYVLPYEVKYKIIE